MTVDLLDSEVLEVEKVMKVIQNKQGTQVDLESFRKEIIDRFAAINIKVMVSGMSAVPEHKLRPSEDGVGFKIDILGRMEEPQEFDYEKMTWEVRKDILDIEPDKKGLVLPFNPEQLHEEQQGGGHHH